MISKGATDRSFPTRHTMNMKSLLGFVLALACNQIAQAVERTVAEYRDDPHTVVDLAMEYWPEQYPPPSSAWIEKEKKSYQALLSKSEFDLLVVPFQVADFGISRPIRSLMAAKLALAIANAGASVADPYLVGRALGEGRRQFDRRDVYLLARRGGANSIVQGYVGHDQHGAMRMIVQVTQLNSDATRPPLVRELEFKKLAPIRQKGRRKGVVR